MPAVHSKPTTDGVKTITFKVIRPEHTFMTDFTCAIADAPRIANAFSDACDIVIMLQKHETKNPLNKYPDSIVMNIQMKELRKICKHKGDEEESLMCNFIQALSPVVGLKVNEIGFPLNKKGKVICDDVLTISISLLEESDIKRM